MDRLSIDTLDDGATSLRNERGTALAHSDGEDLRVVALFSVVAAGLSACIAMALSVLFMGWPGVAGMVALSTGASALAAWLLRRPLARAKATGETRRAALLGVAVTVVAYVGFAAVFSVAYA